MWLPAATGERRGQHARQLAAAWRRCGEHVGAFEPVEQRGDVVRRLPHQPQLAVDPHRRAVGVAHAQQLLRHRRARRGCSRRRRRGRAPASRCAAERHPALGWPRAAPAPRAASSTRSRSARRSRAPRAGRAAGRCSGAPEISPHRRPRTDERDRHRSRRAHVLQVLDVDRRDGAQDAVAQVQPLARSTGSRRLERRGRRLHVMDEPQPVLEEQRARLRRDVAGRIVQAEERVAGRSRLSSATITPWSSGSKR